MRTVNAKCGAIIPIGRLGENEATAVVFDVAEWITLFGAGVFTLLHQRSGDTAPYPCSIEHDGTTVTWTVTSADLGVQGYGKCELVYTVNDTVAKSVIYTTVTGAALTGGIAPPEPWEDWIERVLEAGAAAVEAAASAGTSAESAGASAETAAQKANDAAQSATDAENAKDAAAEASSAAAEKATDASNSASAAATSASAAASSASTASAAATAAEAAQAAAETAQGGAEQAKADAVTAKTDAQTAAATATSKARDAAQSATSASSSASSASQSATDAETAKDDTEDIKDEVIAIVNQMGNVPVVKGNTFTATDTSVTQTLNKVNIKTGAETTESVPMPIANGDGVGFMTPEQVVALEDLESRVGGLENQNVRLSYTASGTPTAAQIRAFVIAAGYTDTTKWATIGVVVKASNHIWRYYDNTEEWEDIGLDTVQQASQSVKGIVQGSSTDGKVFVEADGTMSLNGYDALTTGLSNAQTDITSHGQRITAAESDITSLQNGKMDKVNPTGSGHMTIGTRASGSTAGDMSVAIGDGNVASGPAAVAFGHEVTASGRASFAVGSNAKATGQASFAHGLRITNHDDITASGNGAAAFGGSTLASGKYSMAAGYISKATGDVASANGYMAEADGFCSHAEGAYTKSSGDNQHVFGVANVEDADGTFAEVVGNGNASASPISRSNARALDWDGNERLAGDLYVNCNDDSTGGNKVATEAALNTGLGGKENVSNKSNTVSDDATKYPSAKAVWDYVASGSNGYREVRNISLNTVTKSGFYYCFNCSDNPIECQDSYYGALLVCMGNNNNFGFQIAANTDQPNVEFYIRRNKAGTWSNWLKIQGKLTFDTAPTQGSTNPVTSGGVYNFVKTYENPVLLWENANPDDPFNPQKVLLDLSGYSKVLVETCERFSQSEPIYRSSFIVPVGFAAALKTSPSNNLAYTSSRLCAVYADGIDFTNGAQMWNGGSQYNAQHAIPYRIYGVK